MGLRVAVIHGGVSQDPQVAALRAGVDVLIACPGRLEDLAQQGHCKLGAVEVCVLDEADHLADLGFLPAVKRILDQTPAGGQRMLFSATLDRAVDTLVRRYLTNPVTHSVDSADATPPDLEHHAFTVTPDDKAAVVRELASGKERSLLFTRTKHAAKKLAKDLSARGIPAVDLHGNLSQPQRDRNLAAFADGSVRVLVATDIAARGIHVDDIALVVHVDPPTEHKAYLHRSGRTARAGAKGTVVTVILPDQARDVATMIRQAGIRPASARIGPGAAETAALTGPFAEPVYRPAPAVAVQTQAPAAQPQRPAGRRPARRPGGPRQPFGRTTARAMASAARTTASASSAVTGSPPWAAAVPTSRTVRASAASDRGQVAGGEQPADLLLERPHLQRHAAHDHHLLDRPPGQQAGGPVGAERPSRPPPPAGRRRWAPAGRRRPPARSGGRRACHVASRASMAPAAGNVSPRGDG